MIQRASLTIRWAARSVTSMGLALGFIAQVGTGCAIIADKSMSEKDAEECQVLAEAVLKNHELPSAATPLGHDGRALYCGIRQRKPFVPYLYTEITLYGVAERPEQDRVIATLRHARAQGYKPIIIRVLPGIEWVNTPDPDLVPYPRGSGTEIFPTAWPGTG